MHKKQQNSIVYFQFESFPAWARHALFTRLGGVSQPPLDSLNMSSAVGDLPAVLATNQQRAFGIFGRTTETVAFAHLVHGAEVVQVGVAQHGVSAGKVDGIITKEIGCGLTMNFADCTPIMLVDPVNRAVGLGHAGWQGAIKDLAGEMVRAMVADFGSDAGSLVAGIAPCIGVCCYEVDEPVISLVQSHFPNADELLILQPNSHRPHFDLALANRHNLMQAGVKEIENAGICTACHTDLFYSHRAEKGKTGRFGSIMILT